MLFYFVIYFILSNLYIYIRKNVNWKPFEAVRQGLNNIILNQDITKVKLT